MALSLADLGWMESIDDRLWLIASLCLTSLGASIILFYCSLPHQMDKEIRDDNRAPKKSHLPNTKSLVPSSDDESLLLSSKPLAPDKFNNARLLVGAVLTFSVLALALGVVLYLRWASEYLESIACVALLSSNLLSSITLAPDYHWLLKPVGEPKLPVSVITVYSYLLFQLSLLSLLFQLFQLSQLSLPLLSLSLLFLLSLLSLLFPLLLLLLLLLLSLSAPTTAFSLVQHSHLVFQAFVRKTLPQFLDGRLITTALSSLPLIILMLVVFLKPRETPSAVQFAFYEDWRLTFTTSMGVESRNSVSNNLKLRFEGLIAPLRANWFPFASPEKPLQSDKLRIIASCVSWENSIRFRY
jgi:hypothetical protein